MKKRRNTETKDAVLEVLTNAGKALSRDAIEHNINIDINRATVYRVLNRFCEDGILHKIVAEDGKQYFAKCLDCEEKLTQEQHFHFKCSTCESIECLPIAVNFDAPNGYKVQNVNCIITGVCNTCA